MRARTRPPFHTHTATAAAAAASAATATADAANTMHSSAASFTAQATTRGSTSQLYIADFIDGISSCMSAVCQAQLHPVL